jgi:hypothetical protein
LSYQQIKEWLKEKKYVSSSVQNYWHFIGIKESFQIGNTIKEFRVANKSPHYKFGYFLSISQQAVSSDIIPNSADGIFTLKTEGEQT